MSEEIPEELIDSLNQVYSEIQSGTTFFQAIHNHQLPQLKVRHSIVQNWIPLRDAIIDGKISALETLKTLIDELRSQKKILLILKKKTQSPLMQMYIGSACSLAISLFLYFNSLSVNSTLSLPFQLLLIVLSLQGIAFYVSRKIIFSFRKKLYFLDWIQFISRIHLAMKWGQSLNLAFKEAEEKLLIDHLPKKVQLNLINFKKKLYGHTPSFQVDLSKEKLWKKSQQQLKSLLALYEKGNSVTPFLKLSLDDSYREFQYYMESESEKTSYFLLLPLFFLQVPSFFLVLIYPLWMQLKDF